MRCSWQISLAASVDTPSAPPVSTAARRTQLRRAYGSLRASQRPLSFRRNAWAPHPGGSSAGAAWSRSFPSIRAYGWTGNAEAGSAKRRHPATEAEQSAAGVVTEGVSSVADACQPPLHHNRTFLGRRWARLLMWMVSSHVAVAIGRLSPGRYRSVARGSLARPGIDRNPLLTLREQHHILIPRVSGTCSSAQGGAVSRVRSIMTRRGTSYRRSHSDHSENELCWIVDTFLAGAPVALRSDTLG